MGLFLCNSFSVFSDCQTTECRWCFYIILYWCHYEILPFLNYAHFKYLSVLFPVLKVLHLCFSYHKRFCNYLDTLISLWKSSLLELCTHEVSLLSFSSIKSFTSVLQFYKSFCNNLEDIIWKPPTEYTKSRTTKAKSKQRWFFFFFAVQLPSTLKPTLMTAKIG